MSFDSAGDRTPVVQMREKYCELLLKMIFFKFLCAYYLLTNLCNRSHHL
jgi:hypothetical protein